MKGPNSASLPGVGRAPAPSGQKLASHVAATLAAVQAKVAGTGPAGSRPASHVQAAISRPPVAAAPGRGMAGSAVQAKAAPLPAAGVVQRALSTSVLANCQYTRTGPDESGSYVITATAFGKKVGSIDFKFEPADDDVERVSGDFRDPGPRGAHLHIELVKVKKEQRGTGLGKRLMQEALGAAERLAGKIEYITLEAMDDGSGKLKQWYEKMGFRSYSTQLSTLPTYWATPQQMRSGLLGMYADEL